MSLSDSNDRWSLVLSPVRNEICLTRITDSKIEVSMSACIESHGSAVYSKFRQRNQFSLSVSFDLRNATKIAFHR